MRFYWNWPACATLSGLYHDYIDGRSPIEVTMIFCCSLPVDTHTPRALRRNFVTRVHIRLYVSEFVKTALATFTLDSFSKSVLLSFSYTLPLRFPSPPPVCPPLFSSLFLILHRVVYSTFLANTTSSRIRYIFLET